jgi:hypothetical protein
MTIQNARLRAQHICWYIIAASALVALLSFLVPVVATVQQPFVAHLRTAIALFAALPFIGASVWLMASLGRFKPGVRKAYTMASIGMILLAAGITQLPILGLFDLWNSAWALSGAVGVIFIAGAMLTYFGMRMLTRILDLKTHVTKSWLVVMIAVVFAVLSYFVSPYLVQYDNVKDINSYLAAIGFAGVFMAATAILAYRVSSVIGASYHTAMKIFAFGNGALAFEAFHEYTQSYFMNNGTPYNDYGFYMWPFMTAAVIMVFAAKEFSLINAEADDGNHPAELDDSVYIDSVITTAALVSRPQDVDGILTGLRSITARLSADSISLTNEDKNHLVAVYRQLEDYLTHGNDPLRTFTAEQVRSRLNQEFVAVVATQTNRP